MNVAITDYVDEQHGPSKPRLVNLKDVSVDGDGAPDRDELLVALTAIFMEGRHANRNFWEDDEAPKQPAVVINRDEDDCLCVHFDGDEVELMYVAFDATMTHKVLEMFKPWE